MDVKNKELLNIVLSYFFLRSNGLVPLASEENSIIRATENTIRNITNTLFSQLNFRGTKLNRKLRRYITVHNFLASVTLLDHKNLNEIVRLSRSDKNNVNNETENLIKILNEILDEDLNVTDYISFAPNDNVIRYVDEFMTNLDELKDTSGLNNDYGSLEIKNEIMNILVNNYTKKSNVTLNEKNANPKQGVLLENDFWREPNTRRIYEGRKTKIRHFPFVASIQFFNTFQCGGSIIKSDLVITAASCLQLAWNNRFFRENPAFLSVRVGSNFYNGGGDHIAVLEVYFHPEYTPKTLRHNIALLRLHRHLIFRKNKQRMKKIDIDRQDHSLPLTTDGITVVGWGARGSSNLVHDPWENQIAFAVLDVYGLQECQDVYSKEFVTRKNFCAGFISKGGGACNHDVGGPGVVNGILTGIISFGAPVCGTPDAPTVFTKVGFYAEWIDEIMDQEVPIKQKRTTLKPTPSVYTEPPAHLVPTRLIIAPISPIDNKGTTKGIPVYVADNLRNIKDEKSFQDYISTIFENKKHKEYEDWSSDDNIQKVKEQTTPDADVTQKSVKDLALQLNELNINLDVPELLNDIKSLTESDIESVTMKTIQYTVMDGDIQGQYDDTDNSIEENIVKLLDNIDISSRSNEDVSKDLEVERVTRFESIETYQLTTEKFKPTDKTKKIRGPKTEMKDIKEKQKVMEKNDVKNKDILTLLYLTDDEKNYSAEKNKNGLSIPIDGFEDKNFRNNVTDAVLEFMAKSDITDLLNEAMNDMARIKRMQD